MSERVKVYVQPICGSGTCSNEDPEHEHGALFVRRVTIDGGEVPFTKARIETNAQDVLSVAITLIPGGIEVVTAVDPWSDKE